MALMAAAAIIGAGVSAYGAYNSAQDKKKAEKGLNSWEKTHPQEFKTGQQLYTEASAATPYGFSPQENANFQQGLARRSNQAYRLGTDRNPNFSGAINAAINYGNIGALLQHSAQDAQLKRQLISEKVGVLGRQNNLQTGFNQQVAGQYGQAIQQQKENITNSLYNVANSAAAYGYFTGSDTKTPKPPKPDQPGATGYIQTTPNQMGQTAVVDPLISPYGRQSDPQYANYQAGYNPYQWNPNQLFSTPYK